jgi:hypothetical protein
MGEICIKRYEVASYASSPMRRRVRVNFGEFFNHAVR